MTKADLKTLEQLPRVLAVLRKLAEEAQELRRLSVELDIMPAPIPAGPNGYANPPAVQAGATTQYLHANGGEAGPRLQPALSLTPHQGPLPSLAPQEHLPHLEAKKREREMWLAQKRDSPERLAKLDQFKHDGGDDGDAAQAT